MPNKTDAHNSVASLLKCREQKSIEANRAPLSAHIKDEFWLKILATGGRFVFLLSDLPNMDADLLSNVIVLGRTGAVGFVRRILW